MIAMSTNSKASGQRVSFTLESTVESVNFVERIAETLARISGFDEEERFHVRVAVREAVANAVAHGNVYDPSKKLTVVFATTAEDMTISIADQGPGLDPAELPDPLAPENLLKRSGRGIFLIRSAMDEVHFRMLQPGMEITLRKRRRRDEHRKAG